MTTPAHQVFRHNMKLLLENLDKNEISLDKIHDVLTKYDDIQARIKNMGKYVTEDMLRGFFNENILLDVIERKDIDDIIVYTCRYDGTVQITLTHNVEAQDLYLSPFIRVYDVYDNDKFLFGTGIEYLNKYYELAREVCTK